MKKIKYSEITPENIYKNRRSFIKSLGYGASSLAFKPQFKFCKSKADDK